MKATLCRHCGTIMHRNGTTSAGTTRWRCPNRACGRSRVVHHDRTMRDFDLFLSYLFGKQAQHEMGLNPRTLRKRIQPFWSVWPLARPVDEVLDVIHLDGIHLGCSMVVLIALDHEGTPLGWQIAPSEIAAAWASLIQQIAPPLVAVVDGGGGIGKALNLWWPDTRVQRCVFHVLLNTTRLITSRPRLQAGKELRNLAIRLQHVDTASRQERWINAYTAWHRRWSEFLRQRGRHKDDPDTLMHERLVKAARQLDMRIREQTLFTYLNPEIMNTVPIPAFNNRIESFNARLRALLHQHRGMSRIHQIKLIYWYCYQHSHDPIPLHRLPTDQDIATLSARGQREQHEQEAANPYGTGITWNEFHTNTPYPNASQD